MLRTVILASGRLGFETTKKLANDCEIVAVLTDRSSKMLMEWASGQGIPVFAGNPRNGAGSKFVANKRFEVLLSINYLFIIEKDLIVLPSRYAFNIHGSLLPKNRGRTPHVWAIINGEKETGITIHKITEGCDEGEIALQKRVPIKENYTGNDVLKEFETLYYPLLKEVLVQTEKDELTFVRQDESKASWNDKRTPEDGAINWNWDAERIYNWVRAQADPYPGAFSYLGIDRIIIDEVKVVSDVGSEKFNNGTIISNDPPVVKCKNGAVQITKTRGPVDFKVGQQFKS